VEIAFGRLKARWKRLIKQNDMVVRKVPNVIAAACVLHNMCEIHGDTFPSTTTGSTTIREALIYHFSNHS